MYSKTEIFNLALLNLFIQKRISDADNDTSKEAVTLRTLWNAAWNQGLAKLDLDSTAIEDDLELIANTPIEHWQYAYRYPTTSAYFRRIISPQMTDDRESKIDLKIGYLGTAKVIFTNEKDAIGEWIKNDINPAHLSVEAAVAISFELARMALPFIIGKDSENVLKVIESRYIEAMKNAQAKEMNETSIYQPEYLQSEFVKARLS